MIAANACGRKGAKMPVIGNLDRQVDEVIISPVSKRRREEEPTIDEETPEQAPPLVPTTHTPPPRESSDKPDTLPVWLL
jgi:hypothetical protein